MPPTVPVSDALLAARAEASRVMERAGLRVHLLTIALVASDPRTPSQLFPIFSLPDEQTRRRDPRMAALLANILGEAAADACPPPPAALKELILP